MRSQPSKPQSQLEVALLRGAQVEDVQVVAMLVRRCIAGDAAAWEEIVQTYNRRIYNICYRFAGSSDDAQDLTQEVFIKMYRTLSSYDASKGAFVTWVTTISYASDGSPSAVGAQVRCRHVTSLVLALSTATFYFDRVRPR